MANFFNLRRLLKIAAILAAFLVFYNIPFELLEDNRNTLCLWKRLLNFECPGCGTTRAFWCILHLEFSKAWGYNKIAVSITFPLMSLLTIGWIFLDEKKAYPFLMRFLK
ncbi:MAG: DUF2752 domain-containing protein [Fibromonadaceae bacterium]|jgi:hypothetical protein|nr:DUF2752 domain-containing protein [Fibromonadaceae bacterium]